MPIHSLPEEVANAIAAGEVIERPVSIVKELVENAIDASASSIEIRIRNGGKALVEVADDGVGIHADELELALQRYSTSKLETIDDLHAIHSLGFRGEALASIAAVSKMELISSAAADGAAAILEVEGGKVNEPSQTGAPAGTRVRVRDLFFNVPARRRFLKTDQTERNWISRLVSRYAMAYPEIRFRLESDGHENLRTPGNGNRLEAVGQVLGLEIAEQLIPVQEPQGIRVSLEGYVSPPSLSRSNRREITLFVNGRWIQDISLSSAVVQAYHTLLMVGRHPIALLFLTVPADQVDVNVHPAKAEVRFADPRMVFSTVQRAVRATLLGQAPVQSVMIEPVQQTSWTPADSPIERTIEPPGQTEMFVPVLRSVGQVGAAYLVAEGPDGVYLIDQHAAHERVLFERLMAQVEAQAPESQALLETENVQLAPEQAALLQDQLPTLTALGFQVEPFGGNSFQLRAVPATLSGMSPERALRTVVEDFEEDEAPLADHQEARIAGRVCKAAAIKSGQVLSLAEQRELLRDLEACEAPRTCPHGRPTMVHLSVAALERQFGRRG